MNAPKKCVKFIWSVSSLVRKRVHASIIYHHMRSGQAGTVWGRFLLLWLTFGFILKVAPRDSVAIRHEPEFLNVST